ALEDKVSSGDKSVSAEDAAILQRSANPWVYPAEIRRLLLTPVRDVGVKPPLECNVPLVDAVYMPHEKGVLIPLANYTNKSIAKLTLTVKLPRPIVRAESVLYGSIPFNQRID